APAERRWNRDGRGRRGGDEMIDDPATTAVVCIECQQGVLGEGSVLPSLRADAQRMLPSLERLLDSARQAGLPVVHATYGGPLGGTRHDTAPLWRALWPRTADWGPGHAGVEVLPELLDPRDLVLPRHHGLFPARGTELLAILRGRGVHTLVLTGVSLNVALPMTAGEAVHCGFSVVVPRDAVIGTPAEYGEQMLAHTISMLATVCTVDDLVDDWKAAPGGSINDG